MGHETSEIFKSTKSVRRKAFDFSEQWRWRKNSRRVLWEMDGGGVMMVTITRSSSQQHKRVMAWFLFFCDAVDKSPSFLLQFAGFAVASREIPIDRIHNVW